MNRKEESRCREKLKTDWNLNLLSKQLFLCNGLQVEDLIWPFDFIWQL